MNFIPGGVTDSITSSSKYGTNLGVHGSLAGWVVGISDLSSILQIGDFPFAEVCG